MYYGAYAAEPKRDRIPTSKVRQFSQQKQLSQKAVKKLSRTLPASLGKHSTRGREKMKKGENAIFPLLKDSLSECKYNLKMHRSLKKTHLLWFAME